MNIYAFEVEFEEREDDKLGEITVGVVKLCNIELYCEQVSYYQVHDNPSLGKEQVLRGFALKLSVFLKDKL